MNGIGENRHYRIAIRALVEFTERRGDINFRFSSRSSAQQGIRGLLEALDATSVAFD